MGGSYSPSPGVIYPTLSWLEDMGYARVEAEGGGRKRSQITPEGEAFLTANRAAVDALFSRMGSAGEGGRYEGVPAPVVRGIGEPEARPATAPQARSARPECGRDALGRPRYGRADRGAKLINLPRYAAPRLPT